MIDKLALFLLKRIKNEKTRQFLLKEAVKHHFCAVSSEDILKENPDGTIQFEGKTLDATYKRDLQEQANLLTNLLLWKVLQKDIEYQIRKKMFEETVIKEDMVWGRLIVWLWDVIDTRISKLKNMEENHLNVRVVVNKK